MICTKLFGEFEALFVEVDGDHRAGAFGLECLNHEQADEAGSDNNGRVALLEWETVDAVQGDGNRLSKGGMFVGNVIWNRADNVFGHLDVFGKSSVTAVVVAGNAEYVS